ncbi:hypothetical protein JG687_00016107 [Phytophthora cactorum]|uniref:Uncharacterized protein n=1 Tax=Phytophthora cactorum TaxID=29920 RepID=A0A8T1TWX4_9STRA|nr:hypothetical protein JG687_00016107 [Phytophthora cactorum]
MTAAELWLCGGARPRNGGVSGLRWQSGEGWRAWIQGRRGVIGRCGGGERRR